MSANGLRRALFLALLSFAATHGLYQIGRAFLHPKQGLDLAPEYVAARMLADGNVQFYDSSVLRQYGRQLGLHGPLGPDDPIIDYNYPPWLPLFYVPLSRLPWEAARCVWFAIGLLAAFGAAALAAAAAAPSPEGRRTVALGAVAAACFYFPITYGLMTGQANDLPLLGIAASLWFLRTNRPFLAGLVLAPAGMWKIFTGFPVIFLLARREWKALGGLTLGCAALFVTSLPFVGLATWIEWTHAMVSHNTLVNADPRNHSIATAVILLLRSNTLAPPLVEAPALVQPLTLVLHGLVVLAVLAVLLPAARREDARYSVQFGATLIAGVILTPQAWEHYGVYLLPAFFACFIASALPGGAVGSSGIGDGTGERPAWIALAVTSAAFAVWGLLFQVKDDIFALASGLNVLFIPAKLYASLALIGVSMSLCLARRREP